MKEKKLSIDLNIFKARDYQCSAFKAIEQDGYKRLIFVWSRRAGKDVMCWNIIIRQALLRVGNYFYVFPNKEQARNAIWDSITNDGKKFIDFIPKEIIKNINNVRMSIKLINGSNIQLMGAKTYNSMTGTNPKGIIFSEFAQSEPLALQYAIPIINANEGFIILQSTPRGKNEFYKFFQIAQNNPDTWYSEVRTVDDLKHIDKKIIDSDIEMGIMSEDLVQQEYYCDFSLGVAGSFYAHYLDRMEIEERIGDILWDPSHPVHTSWDLGINDHTAIIMYQVIGQKICILEAYQNKDKGLEFYAKYLKEKPYQYGSHFVPHDARVRDLSTGIERIEKLRDLGIDAQVAPNVSIADGIEAVRTILPRMWINRSTSKDLILSLEHYRKEFDEKRQVYLERARHDRYSDMADSLRYLAITYKSTIEYMTQEDAKLLQYKNTYGNQYNMPKQLRSNPYGRR